MTTSRVTAIRVLGLGNVLMGDDGIGPYVLQVLAATYACPCPSSFIEVGTPGPDLIPYLDGADVLVIVDAVRGAGPPGAIRLYRHEGAAAYAAGPRLGPHDPGLAEALAGLRLSGRGPAEVLLVGVIPERVTTGVGLSPAVRAAVPVVIETVTREMTARGVRLERRTPPRAPDIWWERPRPRPAFAPDHPSCTR